MDSEMLIAPIADEDALPALVPPERLFRAADLSGMTFSTTRDLPSAPMLAGQKRVEEAVRFGTSIDARGFNIFAIGPTAARISPALCQLLGAASTPKKPLSDWVYVNNFALPHRPTAIALPAGRGIRLQKAMRKLIEDLRTTLPALFESDDYQRRRSAIDETLRSSTQKKLQMLGDKAASRGVTILRTPMGFTVAPMEKGDVVEADAFNAWPEDRKRTMQKAIVETERDLEETLRAMPRLEKERRDAVRDLDQETAKFAINQELEELHVAFADLPHVAEHIEFVRADLLQHVQLFLLQRDAVPGERLDMLQPGSPFERYDVNVIVSNDPHGSAPVVEELHPTLGNLLGRVEHMSLQGALVTNFRMIKAGSLHRANGGTIVIDARSLFYESYAWTALKRMLTRQVIVVEDLAHIVGLVSTATLEPEPIPLDVKVVLFGERWIYYLLASLDPEFAQHFKVLADFDDEIERSPANEELLARQVGQLAAEGGLKPLDRGAVAAIIERTARLADDSRKLSLLTEHLHDLVTEADHWAAMAGRVVTSREDVKRAVSEQRRRASRIEERGREMILRGISLIATDGSRPGQINGLSVIDLAGHAFGRPSRITARVGPGAGKIVDIEREVALGGPIHSKGVLILSGFISGRFARQTPMSLQAALVFEQSYGGVEGDSASVAELCALLSALGNIPLRQDIAVTGSVNQHGDVQPIGGVNEKIEGFYEVCTARGLTGRQGVLIPASNVQHLMLREDVVAACRRGEFGVYAMSTIDQAMALLTGLSPGERKADGYYAEGTVNHAIEDCLARFAEARKAMAAGGKSAEH
jgi:lon-related putative ATP-dependent protease